MRLNTDKPIIKEEVYYISTADTKYRKNGGLIYVHYKFHNHNYVVVGYQYGPGPHDFAEVNEQKLLISARIAEPEEIASKLSEWFPKKNKAITEQPKTESV